MDLYTEESRIRGTLRRTPVLLRESVLLVKGNSTRLAELGTRSVGSQASLARSDPPRATWTPWTAAAAQSLRWSSCQQATSAALSHVHSAAPAGRQLQPKSTATPEKPAKKARTSPTASPEKPVKNRRDSLPAFAAAPRFRASRIHTDRGTALTRRQRSTKEPPPRD